MKTKVIKTPNKYKVLDLYVYSGKTNREIAQELGIADKTVENTIRKFYKDFTAVRETKSLLASQSKPVTFNGELLELDDINKGFLSKLSEPDSHVLTDNELLFCEMYHQDGDEMKAIETSKLNFGISPHGQNLEAYKTAVHLRGYFLRRKPNVASYLEQLQKERLSVLDDGKVFIQSELLSVINKLKKMDGERATANYLKSIETLGRILGAFDDKVTVETVSGDSALDVILSKAREVNGNGANELIEA